MQYWGPHMAYCGRQYSILRPPYEGAFAECIGHLFSQSVHLRAYYGILRSLIWHTAVRNMIYSGGARHSNILKFGVLRPRQPSNDPASLPANQPLSQSASQPAGKASWPSQPATAASQPQAAWPASDLSSDPDSPDLLGFQRSSHLNLFRWFHSSSSRPDPRGLGRLQYSPALVFEREAAFPSQPFNSSASQTVTESGSQHAS